MTKSGNEKCTTLEPVVSLLQRDIAPQLSSISSDGPPAGYDSLHEIKLDGFRMLCPKDGDSITFFSRNGASWGDRFTGIADADRRLPADKLWLDGELVAMLEDGSNH